MANTIIYKQPDLTKEHFKSALYASVANFFVTKKKKNLKLQTSHYCVSHD